MNRVKNVTEMKLSQLITYINTSIFCITRFLKCYFLICNWGTLNFVCFCYIQGYSKSGLTANCGEWFLWFKSFLKAWKWCQIRKKVFKKAILFSRNMFYTLNFTLTVGICEQDVDHVRKAMRGSVEYGEFCCVCVCVTSWQGHGQCIKNTECVLSSVCV